LLTNFICQSDCYQGCKPLTIFTKLQKNAFLKGRSILLFTLLYFLMKSSLLLSSLLCSHKPCPASYHSRNENHHTCTISTFLELPESRV